ncbi:MAG: hypothetical protein IPM61_05765 [Chlorobi bacterium]|nr:hypothetical protein [Chlorobiota bacterium]MBX7216084.1 hypothetical protein [Candidatus Kapabacteria bacterium]
MGRIREDEVANDWKQGVWDVDLAWGRRGARDAAARDDVMVVVAVLSFSIGVASVLREGCFVRWNVTSAK